MALLRRADILKMFDIKLSTLERLGTAGLIKTKKIKINTNHRVYFDTDSLTEYLKFNPIKTRERHPKSIREDALKFYREAIEDDFLLACHEYIKIREQAVLNLNE